MKITTALGVVAFLGLPAPAWSQDAPIKLYSAPLLSTLGNNKWVGLHYDVSLVDAVRAALLQAPFQAAPGPAADVLSLAVPDRVKNEGQKYIFTVVFSRDGTKLGEAVESCPMDTLTDCTDQLVLDIKSAAKR